MIRGGPHHAMLLLLSIMCMAIVLPPDSAGESPPPAEGVGDWVVSEDTEIRSEVIVIDGNITVESEATLTLINCELSLHDNNTIKVEEGSTLDIVSTTIDGVTEEDFYKFYVYGTMKAETATISRTWGPPYGHMWKSGVQVVSGDVDFRNTTFRFAAATAVGIEGGKAEFTECLFKDNGYFGLIAKGLEGGLNISRCSFEELSSNLKHDLSISDGTVAHISDSVIGELIVQDSADVTVESTEVKHASTRRDCRLTFLNSTHTDYLTLSDNAEMAFINSPFNSDDISEFDDDCAISVGGFLNVEVLDATSEPVSSASVRIDDNGDPPSVEYLTAGRDGRVMWNPVTSYILQGNDRTNLTPHQMMAVSGDLYGSEEVRVEGGVHNVTVVLDGTHPRVVDTSPEDGAADVPHNLTEVRILFSEAMDNLSDARLLNVTPTTPEYEVTWGEGGTEMVMAFQGNLTHGENYTVSISRELKNAAGKPMFSNYSFMFQVENTSDDIDVVDDMDGDGIPDDEDLDIDGDGVPNDTDAFPWDPDESQDYDGDGIGDKTDYDIDGDGAPNDDDPFPLDPEEQFDTDGDGIGNVADLDDDGDGVRDVDDPDPLDKTVPGDIDHRDYDDDDDAATKVLWALFAFSLVTVLVIIILAIVVSNRPPPPDDEYGPQEYNPEEPKKNSWNSGDRRQRLHDVHHCGGCPKYWALW